MDKRIRERYGPHVLKEAMSRYGIAADRIKELDGFESFIYEFSREARDYILRVGHSGRRSENLIHGEVDWMNYLAARGAAVAQAVPSQAGNLVEAFDDGQGEYFLATSFVRACGRSPREVGWTPALFETYGEVLGKMHSLTKSYRPPRPEWKRPEWDDPAIQDIARNLPASETGVLERYHALIEHLRGLPRDKDAYGLIHFDAHGSNFLVGEDGRITLFDFDDCSYGWFAYDLAIVLFYMVTGREDSGAFAEEFMCHFLKGYRRNNRLDPEWLKEMPRFLKMREIDLYAVIHRSFDIENLDNQWCARFMDGRKSRIEEDVPYIDFDFEGLRGHL
jgi:Ser/Thr protein kinase RdoA (MazF antagonist)